MIRAFEILSRACGLIKLKCRRPGGCELKGELVVRVMSVGQSELSTYQGHTRMLGRIDIKRDGLLAPGTVG